MKTDPLARFADAVAPDGRLVRDNFQRWFQGSTVVDEAGQALVVYHGTLVDFDRLELGHGEAQSHGFFFVGQNNVNSYLWAYLTNRKAPAFRPGM